MILVAASLAKYALLLTLTPTPPFSLQNISPQVPYYSSFLLILVREKGSFYFSYRLLSITTHRLINPYSVVAFNALGTNAGGRFIK
jgi:hypothetical protein